MHHNRPSKQILLLFPALLSLVVVLLGCNLTSTPTPAPTSTPTPDTLVLTVAALEATLARHARDAGANAATLQAVAVMETNVAGQSTRIAVLYDGLSYLATRVGALPAPTFTTTPPTRTPYAPLLTLTPPPPPVKSFPSPDGSRLALVRGRGTLIIQEGDGSQRELLTTGEISGVDWFPDGNHLVYGDYDLALEVTARRGRLWVVDVETGENRQIGTGYGPHVSPDGGRIAVLYGVLWGDACFVGYDVAILELDEDMYVVGITHQDDFAGLPGKKEAEEERNASFYPVSSGGGLASDVWRSNTELAVGLRWTCTGLDDPENGVYLLDLETLQAERIGELETE